MWWIIWKLTRQTLYEPYMHTSSTESLMFKEQGEVEEKGISVREYVK